MFITNSQKQLLGVGDAKTPIKLSCNEVNSYVTTNKDSRISGLLAIQTQSGFSTLCLAYDMMNHTHQLLAPAKVFFYLWQIHYSTLNLTIKFCNGSTPFNAQCAVRKLVVGPTLLHIINLNKCYGFHIQTKISKNLVHIGKNVVNTQTQITSLKKFLDLYQHQGTPFKRKFQKLSKSDLLSITSL